MRPPVFLFGSWPAMMVAGVPLTDPLPANSNAEVFRLLLKIWPMKLFEFKNSASDFPLLDVAAVLTHLPAKSWPQARPAAGPELLGAHEVDGPAD